MRLRAPDGHWPWARRAGGWEEILVAVHSQAQGAQAGHNAGWQGLLLEEGAVPDPGLAGPPTERLAKEDVQGDCQKNVRNPERSQYRGEVEGEAWSGCDVRHPDRGRQASLHGKCDQGGQANAEEGGPAETRT